MRIWQYYAVNELSRYGLPVMQIAETTGLTTVAVAQIQDGAKLPDTFLLQADTDMYRCPICRNIVLSPCFLCYSDEVGPDHTIEVINRPISHQNYMLNVHLIQEDTITK